MRCGDVIRELSAPTGRLASAAAAEHLEQCARCASWAARDVRLSQLWDATQPAPLSDEAWERIWSPVAASFDRPAQPARPRPWHRSMPAVLVIGQAAAILLGFALLYSQRVGGPKRTHPESTVASASPTLPQQSETAVATAALSHWSFEADETPLISVDDLSKKNLSADLALNDNPNGVDPFLNLYNAMEGNAGLQ